jgi:hypothetical protein
MLDSCFLSHGTLFDRGIGLLIVMDSTYIREAVFCQEWKEGVMNTMTFRVARQIPPGLPLRQAQGEPLYEREGNKAPLGVKGNA